MNWQFIIFFLFPNFARDEKKNYNKKGEKLNLTT